MTFGQQLTNFFINQGPAILILVYAYMNGKAIRAENEASNIKLQKSISDAHAKIDAKYAGMPDDAAINALLGAITPAQSDPSNKK